MEEILEQPAALAAVRKHYTGPGVIPESALGKIMGRRHNVVVFTGMGSSLYAALPAQAYLSSVGIRSVVWEAAELVRFHINFLGPETPLVAISQSGETVEILRLLKKLPKGKRIAALTNSDTSTLARRSDLVLPMLAGGQKSASTKTYTCAVAALMYLAFAMAGEAGNLLTKTLERAVAAQKRVLERRDALTPPGLEFFGEPPYVLLMSRGPDLSSVHQGALMFKEVARVGAEPMGAGQFRHGAMEIINPAHRYVVFARRNRFGRRGWETQTAALLLKLAQEIGSHGGRVLLLTDQDFAESTDIRVVEVEPLALGLGTLVDSVHIQLLVHDLAVRAGREPGKFWLSKPVTREE